MIILYLLAATKNYTAHYAIEPWEIRFPREILLLQKGPRAK